MWGSPTPSCNNNTSAPSVLYADDPENWSDSNWAHFKAVELEQQTISSSGLIFYYFLNQFSSTAHLYIGTTATGASFQYIVGQKNGGSPYALYGAQASAQFLQNYVPNTGYTSAVAGSGATPKPFATAMVPAQQVISGEIAIKNLSTATTFYVYADICASGCPSIAHIAPPQESRPPYRRGIFPGASFAISHDFTEALVDNGSGYSYWDLLRTPPPAPMLPVCAAPLAGRDNIENVNQTLAGNFGVPITITGTSQKMNVGQVWYLAPSGGTPFATALWLQGFLQPKTRVAIPAGAYAVPFKPGPVPTVIPTANDAVVLGLNDNGDARTIVYIPSGGDNAPVRFYYLDPTP